MDWRGFDYLVRPYQIDLQIDGIPGCISTVLENIYIQTQVQHWSVYVLTSVITFHCMLMMCNYMLLLNLEIHPQSLQS